MMKLNVAVDSNFSVRMAVMITAVSVLLFLAAPVMALDGIDLSAAPASGEAESMDADGGGCSALVKIKYPFLECASGEIGLSDKSDDWDSARQIPELSEWTDGTGWWGPDRNGD